MKKSIVFIFLVILLSSIAMAIDQYPTGNIIMRNTYSVLNLSTAQGNIANFTTYIGVSTYNYTPDISAVDARVTIVNNTALSKASPGSCPSGYAVVNTTNNGVECGLVASTWNYTEFFNQNLNTTNDVVFNSVTGNTANFTSYIGIPAPINYTPAIVAVDDRVTSVNNSLINYALNSSLSSYAVLNGNNNFVGNNSFVGNIIIYNSTQTDYNTTLKITDGGSNEILLNASAKSIYLPNAGSIYIKNSTGTNIQAFTINAGDNFVFTAPSIGDTYFNAGSNTLTRILNTGQVNLGGTSATLDPVIKILSTGLVGIGLGRSSPTANMDINGSTSPVLRVTQNNDAYKIAIFKAGGANNQGIVIGNSTDGATNGRGFHIGFWQTLGFGYLAAYDWANSSYQPISFQGRNITFDTGVSTTSTKMFINESGNVGIGTLRPVSTLDVNGTITGTAFSGVTKPMVASWDAGCNDGNFMVAIDSNFTYCATPTVATSGFNVTGDLRTVGNEYMTGNEFITGNMNVSGSINATTYNGITKQMVKNWDTACTAGNFISAIDENFTYCNTPTNAQTFNITANNTYTTTTEMQPIILLNNATVWLDAPSVGYSAAGANSPSLTAWNGTVAEEWCFAGTTRNEYMVGSVEFPHDMKEGSMIDPHIHTSKSTANSGNYTFNIAGFLKNVTGDYTQTFNANVTVTTGGQWSKVLTSFGDINTTGFVTGSTFNYRIIRLQDAATDNYADCVGLEQFSFHYESDTLGSASRYGKWG